MEFKLFLKHEQKFIPTQEGEFVSRNVVSDTDKNLPKIPESMKFIYSRGILGLHNYTNIVTNDIKKFLTENYYIEKPLKCSLVGSLVEDSNAIRFILDTQEITVEEYNG